MNKPINQSGWKPGTPMASPGPILGMANPDGGDSRDHQALRPPAGGLASVAGVSSPEAISNLP